MEHLYVADTNLFFECKRLEGLPWADLAVDPVVIALTKPVLAEIDKHKKGRGRTRKRAIEISGRVRGMLDGGTSELVVQEAGPRVVLRLMPIEQPDPSLKSSLDYTINDDRIVGIVSALTKTATFATVSMLTDDSVAASTAHSLNLGFTLIPATWKRPSEATPEEKQVKGLKEELASYKAQEPAIVIKDATDEKTKAHVTRCVALPLETAMIEQLIETLQTRHPMCSDFAAPPTEKRPDGTEISHEAPAEEALEKYKAEYSQWLGACRSMLANLHEGRVDREAPIALTFSLSNRGSRPASKMRLTFETFGDIYLSRNPNQDDDDEKNDNLTLKTAAPLTSRLPAPPMAPEIRRIVKRPPPPPSKGLDISTLRTSGLPKGITAMEKFAAGGMAQDLNSALLGLSGAKAALNSIYGRSGISDIARGAGSVSELMRAARGFDFAARSALESAIVRPAYLEMPHIKLPRLPDPHDPEGFYYDDWPPLRPTKRGALTCDLFRHHRNDECFDVNVLFPKEGDIKASVLCTVEAENLTKPVTLRIPVSRSIEEYSLVDFAEQLVEDCGG